MTISLIAYVFGNTLLALPLAVLAWCVGRSQRHPGVAHVLWTLVLVRLLLPPIATLPWLSLQIPAESLVAVGDLAGEVSAMPQRSPSSVLSDSVRRRFVGDEPNPSTYSMSARPVSLAAGSIVAGSIADRAMTSGSVEPVPFELPSTQPLSALSARQDIHREITKSTLSAMGGDPLAISWLRCGVTVLVAIWGIGSGSLILVSIYRVLRFRNLLRHGAVPADEPMQRLAKDAVAALGRPVDAEILVTRARTPPFVWWLGIRPQIVLPKGIVEGLPEGEQLLVIAHELAHIARKDHLVRWLEWAALAWLWWNPLAWIARRGLRSSEELACDALVLRALNPEPREYSSCLLSVAEGLSETRLATPSLACTMSAGQSLEQRILLIMSHGLTNRPSIALRGCAAAVAGIVLLLGVAGGKERTSPANSPTLTAVEDSEPAQTTPVVSPPSNPPPTPGASPKPKPQPSPSPAPGWETKSPAVTKQRETQTAARRVLIEKVVDRFDELSIETMNSPIHVIRDDSTETIRITAEIEPASDEITDRLFAADAAAVKIIAEPDGEGALQVGLSWKPDNRKKRDDWSDLAMVERVSRIRAKLTIRIPKLNDITIESMNGDLRVDGDVGQLQAEVMSGDIEIRDIVEEAVVESINGSLRISLADSARSDIVATTVNGSISLSLPAEWRGSIDAKVPFGDIEITNLPGSVKKKSFGEKYSTSLDNENAVNAELDTFNGSIQIQRR